MTHFFQKFIIKNEENRTVLIGQINQKFLIGLVALWSIFSFQMVEKWEQLVNFNENFPTIETFQLQELSN